MPVDMHQDLMDEAYKVWENSDMNYNQFVAMLDHKHRLAVLTGNLNYQVGNGGFYQWHINDYSSEAEQLLTLLSIYEKEPYVKVVYDLVKKAVDIIDKYQYEINELGNGWNSNYNDEIDYLENQMVNELDELDDKYYKIDEKFMETMEQILRKL